MKHLISLIAAAAMALAISSSAWAQTRITLLSPDPLKREVDKIVQDFVTKTGIKVQESYGTGVGTRRTVQEGGALDVTLLFAPFDEALKTGNVDKSTQTVVARVRLAVAVKQGTPKPDISNAAAVKKLLLNAKSMTWVEVGASRVHIEKMLDDLGIAKDIKPKVVLTQGVDQSVASVAAGKTELLITLMSEIVPAKGIELVGPFPAKVQGYVSLAGGVSITSKNVEAGRSLLKILAAPSTAPIYQAKGMELITVGDVRPRPPAK